MIHPRDYDNGPFDRPDDYGNSPLSLALTAGRLDAARVLLESSAPRERIDSLGQGLWHFAAGYRKRGYLELALAFPSDPDLARGDGMRPLHIAAMTNNLPAVNALLSAGAHANLRMATGELPLSIALRFAHAEIARILADSAPPESCGMADGTTELHYGAASGNVAYIRYLLARGANPDIANLRGETPLLVAVLYEREEAVRLLLLKGANPDHRTAKGLSIRDIARTRHSVIIRKILAEFVR
jgi:ankyrin repeat protein